MTTDELDEIVKHLEGARYVGASKAAAMLRQLQTDNDALKDQLNKIITGCRDVKDSDCNDDVKQLATLVIKDCHIGLRKTEEK